MTARRRLAVAAVAALLWGCAEQKDTSLEAARSYIREVGGEDVKDAGRLQVSTTDVQTDGRIAKIRGGVQNTFDQQVEGIRYVVTIYENGPAAKVLDRWQHEADTTIEPGDRAPMRLDVESMYLLASGGRFTILAVPVKLGGQPVPPPDGWR
jgi:hypothetical protein